MLEISSYFRITGYLSQLRAKLRDLVIRPVRAGCYSWPAWSLIDSNTLYIKVTLAANRFSINRSYGIHIVWPISKRLMCGDVGAGAMEEPDKIARQVRIALENQG